MFLNISNHTSSFWDEKQRKEAEKWGEIQDYPFPIVPENANEEEIEQLAEKISKEVLALKPDRVMCQGEFTLCFALVNMLKKHQIPVVAACSKREVRTENLKDGGTKKITEFHFVGFRQYL